MQLFSSIVVRLIKENGKASMKKKKQIVLILIQYTETPPQKKQQTEQLTKSESNRLNRCALETDYCRQNSKNQLNPSIFASNSCNIGGMSWCLKSRYSRKKLTSRWTFQRRGTYLDDMSPSCMGMINLKILII